MQSARCVWAPSCGTEMRSSASLASSRSIVTALLDNGEDCRQASRVPSCGRHRRAQDPALGVVESDLLGLDRDDRHDRLACIARRRRLGGWCGPRLSRRGVGGQRRQYGDRREHHGGGTPQRRISAVDCAVMNRSTMP